MALGFRKFISEVFVNGKFPKILPSKNFPLYSSTVATLRIYTYHGYTITQLVTYAARTLPLAHMIVL